MGNAQVPLSTQLSGVLPSLHTQFRREFLTRPCLTTILRCLLQATGMSEEHSHLYGSHSLHIGAATDAGAAGLPDWLIQATGRWKSMVFHRYIRSPKKVLLRVVPALATQAESKQSSGECHQQYGILGKLGGRHRSAYARSQGTTLWTGNGGTERQIAYASHTPRSYHITGDEVRTRWQQRVCSVVSTNL